MCCQSFHGFLLLLIPGHCHMTVRIDIWWSAILYNTEPQVRYKATVIFMFHVLFFFFLSMYILNFYFFNTIKNELSMTFVSLRIMVYSAILGRRSTCKCVTRPALHEFWTMFWNVTFLKILLFSPTSRLAPACTRRHKIFPFHNTCNNFFNQVYFLAIFVSNHVSITDISLPFMFSTAIPWWQ
jgi:hypothetical protein